MNLSNCSKCKLHEYREENNYKVVIGSGSLDADLMIIGEAPGEQEGIHGEPFIGRAGQLLTKMLESIGLDRDKDVYITNIVKCRPPNNRDPEKDELESCYPYLRQQISEIKPKAVLCLGRISARDLLGYPPQKSLKELRRCNGSDAMMSDHTFKFFVTYHPAALLRNPNWKDEAFSDLLELQKELN